MNHFEHVGFKTCIYFHSKPLSKDLYSSFAFCFINQRITHDKYRLASKHTFTHPFKINFEVNIYFFRQKHVENNCTSSQLFRTNAHNAG